MNELQQVKLQILKCQKDIASLNWKKRNPDRVKNYQNNYRKIYAKELAEKAKQKRKLQGDKINARRRELYAIKKENKYVMV